MSHYINLFGKSLIHSDITSVIVVISHYDFTGALGQNNHLINVPGGIKAIMSVYESTVLSLLVRYNNIHY